MERRFIGCFDAELADQRCAGIFGELLVLLEVFHVAFADGRDITERVHRVLAVWIEASETRGDVHAGEFEAMHGEAAREDAYDQAIVAFNSRLFARRRTTHSCSYANTLD